jgi:CBS domain-containing membrane protein
MQLFIHFFTDPVSLNLKGKLVAVLSCFVAILIIAVVTQVSVGSTLYPILVASMGASAVILFIIPSSPLAQPWPFVGGQLCSALVGVTCAQVFPETAISAAFAAGGSVLIMLLLRCLHPPGSATALAPVLAGEPLTALGFDFVLFPVAVNVGLMLIMSLLINRWIMGRDYPIYSMAKKKTQDQPPISTNKNRSNINEDDLNYALNKSETFVDVSAAEIKKLLLQAEKHHYKQKYRVINCADIMSRDIVTVEYGNDVETAWALMYQKKLQAMPVIDKANRVIGIITWSDFFKHLNLNVYDSLQEKFRAFIRRSTEINTNKPESIGHLMTKSVKVVAADSHIIELIPFMSEDGFRQVPIVNNEKRLVGMVYQPQLIAALYQSQQQAKNE